MTEFSDHVTNEPKTKPRQRWECIMLWWPPFRRYRIKSRHKLPLRPRTRNSSAQVQMWAMLFADFERQGRAAEVFYLLHCMSNLRTFLKSTIFERGKKLRLPSLIYSSTVAARSHRLLLQAELLGRSVSVCAESPGPPGASAQHGGRRSGCD